MNPWRSLRVRRDQGWQYIRDVRAARPAGFVGLPQIAEGTCGAGCQACADVCPTQAISPQPLQLDLGRCVFCTECVAACPEQRIRFTTDPRLAATAPDELQVRPGDAADRTRVRAHALFARLFGRSLRLRQVSAGGCNACELELNATANVNFDLQRFGIEWVASPRHADALVLTGPITATMADAVRSCWEAMPEPRFLVAVGACAISGGLYAEARGVQRTFLADVAPVLYVPGCPPHPLTFAHAILDLLDR
ncbi:MAG: NADH:ubiquinone oxidoreductase [Planctomycetes bacterium]|nr:NADH:ubiquinone oxidoreductase [Planctomycetota bacterium]